MGISSHGRPTRSPATEVSAGTGFHTTFLFRSYSERGLPTSATALKLGRECACARTHTHTLAHAHAHAERDIDHISTIRT